MFLSEYEKKLLSEATQRQVSFLDKCLERQVHFLSPEEAKELFVKKEALLRLVEKLRSRGFPCRGALTPGLNPDIKEP